MNMYHTVALAKEHKNKKINISTKMNSKFEKLLEHFYQATTDAEKNTIYGEMEGYAYSFRRDYSCYDVDMYVALYKCAMVPYQRKNALNHISSIIADDYIGHEELIDNFKEFVSMDEFLKDEDKDEFDILCMTELDFFKKELKWAEAQVNCGQADFGVDVCIPKAVNELKGVAGLIVSTGMLDLESYQEAVKVLNSWEGLAVSVSHGFSLN